MTRLALVVFLLVAVTGCAHVPAASLTDPRLLGCWRVHEERQLFRDGQLVVANGDCTMVFGPAELQSRCSGPRTFGDFLKLMPAAPPGTTLTLEKERVQALMMAPSVVSTYRYRIDRPGHYVATATESTLRTMIGWLPPPQDTRYSFDADRLKIAVDIPPAGGERVGLARVESTLVRVAPEAGASECPPRPAP